MFYLILCTPSHGSTDCQALWAHHLLLCPWCRTCPLFLLCYLPNNLLHLPISLYLHAPGFTKARQISFYVLGLAQNLLISSHNLFPLQCLPPSQIPSIQTSAIKNSSLTFLPCPLFNITTLIPLSQHSPDPLQSCPKLSKTSYTISHTKGNSLSISHYIFYVDDSSFLSGGHIRLNPPHQY